MEAERRMMQEKQDRKSGRASGIPMHQMEVVGNQAMLNQTGIPDTLKAKVEAQSGISLDTVKVHYDSPKPAAVQALAYTSGDQVYLGPGQEKHLGHELGHVVQQMQGRVRPTGLVNGLPLNDDPALEREADTYR